MSLVGNLADLALGDILQIVAVSRRSGVLQLNSVTAQGQVTLDHGLVVAVFRSDHDQTVGEYLLGRGFIAPTQYQEMLASDTGGERSYAVLRQIGQPDSVVEKALEAMLKSILYSMFDWSDGTFTFDVTQTIDPWQAFRLNASHVAVHKGLNPQYLALEGIRLRDEREHKDVLSHFLARQQPPQPLLRKQPSPKSNHRLQRSPAHKRWSPCSTLSQRNASPLTTASRPS
ncbi:MAG: DUF4388 domain-containing protein [Myxococcota bacterium]